MAEAIFKKPIIYPASSLAYTAGRQIIDIITSGMYSNPLMVLREYIQNAADSLDEAVSRNLLTPENAFVIINIDGANRSISIFDNGIGVEYSEVESVLASLGISTKISGEARGFRGIGRLGGIGYSDRVLFETKTCGSDRVSLVNWDCEKLREGLAHSGLCHDIGSLLRASIAVTDRKAKEDEPPHFFKVVLFGVHRFHKDDLVNETAVFDYICQAAPVPYDYSAFPMASLVDSHLSTISSHKAYNIYLNEKRVLKPHSLTFEIKDSQFDSISAIETFRLLGREKEIIGAGWYARTGYLAALSPKVLMRGIRIRQGNIEVGDAYFLESAFTERRFATWHIGEVEVNYDLKLNARRDGFEQSSTFEAFLEQMASLGRYLSRLCRDSSKARSVAISVNRKMATLEGLLNNRYYIDRAHFDVIKQKAIRLFRSLESENGNISRNPDLVRRLERSKQSFSIFDASSVFLTEALDGRRLRHKTQKALLKEVASTLSKENTQGLSNEQIVSKVVGPYLRKSLLCSKRDLEGK